MDIKEFLLLSTISGTENFNMPFGDSGFADSNSTPFDGGTPITYGAMNIPSDITDVIVYVILNDDDALFDSFTINTDFIASVSLDNGSIFNNVTLVSLGTSTANGQRRLYKGTLNLTGITNTNLFKLRLTSNGDPTIAIYGVGAFFVAPQESSESLTVEEIVDGILDEPLAGHLTAGTVGKGIADADAVADPSAVADAVWNSEDRTLTGEVDSDCLSIGTVTEVKNFIKKYAAGYTEKQLLALILKQLKNNG